MTRDSFKIITALMIAWLATEAFSERAFASDPQKPWADRSDRAAVLAELRDVSLAGMSRRLVRIMPRITPATPL